MSSAYNATAPLDPSGSWIMQLVAFRAAGPPPRIFSLAPAAGSVGTLVTIAGTNFGATNGASTVAFGGITASPITWDATSIVVPVPAGVTTAGVVVTVNGVASNGILFAVDRAPELFLIDDQNSVEGEPVSLAIAASDPDFDPLTYGATNLPGGLVINPATGLISGTLTFANASTYAVTATAYDGLLTASRTFTWTVTNVNRAPRISPIPNQTSAKHAAISLVVSATDPDADTLSYGATGLPPQLGIGR